MTEAYVVWFVDYNEDEIVEDCGPLYIFTSLQAAREAMESLIKEAARGGCKIEMVSEREVDILDIYRTTYLISKTPVH